MSTSTSENASIVRTLFDLFSGKSEALLKLTPETLVPE